MSKTTTPNYDHAYPSAAAAAAAAAAAGGGATTIISSVTRIAGAII